ncbi:MAG: hypothetical protein H6659_17420 [Ardenticatenaceae bacterium]|nr:hypothetical protein [Ardenticatenaceae bacterium]
MRGCLNALAAVVAGLFVATAVFALLLVNGAHVITNRAALKEALALDDLLRDTLPTVIAGVVEEQARAQGLPVPELDTAVLAETVLATLPPDWLAEVTDTAVDALLDYLETGDPAQAVVAVDVSPVLAQWQGEVGRQAVLSIVQSLPTCTDLSSFDLTSGTLPTCVPPGIPAEELAVQLFSVVSSTVLPQIVGEMAVVRIPLLSEAMLTPGQLATLHRLQQWYALAGKAWRLWLLPLACLLLILLLAVRSAAGWGYWWGVPMAAAGLLGLLLAVLLPAVGTWLVRTAVIPDAAAGATAVWGSFLRQGIYSLAVLWGRRMLWQAGSLLLLGVIFVSFGFLTSRSGGRY